MKIGTKKGHNPKTAQTAILTGASGFLGRYIARELNEFGFEVTGVDVGSEENAPLERLYQYARMELPSEDFGRLIETVRPNVLVHCAGRASVPVSMENPREDFFGNTALCFELLDTIRLHSPETKFVLLSSAAVYGNPSALPVSEGAAISPVSPYGFHKRQAELICQEFSTVFSIPTCALRIFSAFGPGLRRQLLWDLVNKCVSSDTLLLRGGGTETRDFVHARDVAQAVRIAVKRAPFNGECFNVASGEAILIKDVAGWIASALGRRVAVEFDGIEPAGIPLHWQACTKKLQSIGFVPQCSLQATIKEYVDWARPLVVS